ncbi:hypothetical protein HMPREF0491_02334, partial [Lachnospiraceae oral taxon 107 str. F0167]
MKKIAIKIFICLIFFGSIWFLYKRYIDYNMIQKVEKQPDMVFSCRILLVEIKEHINIVLARKTLEKISENILQELS